jgi:hypothetical protein
MASEDIKDRAFALRSLCRNKEVTRLAVYEVLYRFRKRDKEQWLDEGNELTLLITDPALPVNHRTSIVMAMGGMGYYYHARYLLDLLKNTPVNDENIPFIAGLDGIFGNASPSGSNPGNSALAVIRQFSFDIASFDSRSRKD